MAVLPDRDAARRIAAFLDEHAGWSVFWDKWSGVWRVSEDDSGSELYAEDADAGRVIEYMNTTASDVRGGEETTTAETETGTDGAAVVIDPRIIAFMLPGIPGSVRVARFHVRAALAFHDLGQFADDAAVITSDSLNLLTYSFGLLWRVFVSGGWMGCRGLPWRWGGGRSG